jgi:hypothetical protein
MEGAHAMRPFVAYPTPTLLIPIAEPEFINAPLLKVPPASRGEPRRGSVPPACRGNLKEGVAITAIFYELWLCNWYYTDRKGRVYNCPPGILLPAQALGGEPRQAQRASERQPPWDNKPVRSQRPTPTRTIARTLARATRPKHQEGAHTGHGSQHQLYPTGGTKR